MAQTFKTKVMVLVHADLVPPDEELLRVPDDCPWHTEYDVVHTLRSLGHRVQIVGLRDNLNPLKDKLLKSPPDLVFNLMEEFASNPNFDQNVVSFLELMDVPYTGCNPRGMMLARDKALAKKLFVYHDIKTPAFLEFPKKKPGPYSLIHDLKFPLIVKCQNEEASLGISKSSVVYDQEKLKERVFFMQERFGTDIICEEFIRGRELFVGVIGNQRLQCLPAWEIIYNNTSDPNGEIYTERAKFSESYRRQKGIKTEKAKISDGLAKRINHICKQAYQALHISGYCRFDLRVSPEDEIFLIEANPNPGLSSDDEFAESAKAKNISYGELLSKILRLALSRKNSL